MTDPRKETFLGMLKSTFCPQMTWYYFTAIVSLVDIVTFIICVIGSLVEFGGLRSTVFLGPIP